MFLPPAHAALSTGYILASLLSCDPVVDPPVTLDFQNKPPLVDNSRTPQQMQSLRTGATSPDYGGEFEHVQGVKDGKYQFSFSLDFEKTEWFMIGKACVQPAALHLTLTYTPVIYISKDIAPGTCDYNVTLEHEMRHVKVDVDTLGEFIPSIKTMAAAAMALHQSREPVAQENVEIVQNNLSREITALIDSASAKLQATRTLRQQAVDSREEYIRLSNACPH